MKICRLGELQMSSKGGADKDFFSHIPTKIFLQIHFSGQRTGEVTSPLLAGCAGTLTAGCAA